MMWRGVVLEESLENKSVLGMVKVVGTNVNKLEKENRIFAFHNIEVPDSIKDEYVDKVKNVIKQGFYTHLCKGGRMVVIFRNKVFDFRANDPDLIKAREYGKLTGIIPEQMPFEHLIDNPFD
jgi:hypothetical protein